MEDDVMNGGQAPVENQPVQASDFDTQPTSSDGFDEDGFPIQPTEPQAPEGDQGGEPADPNQPATPEGPKFRTPDGRELTADQMYEEYNKLLPEFTRRSQELSELRKIAEQINNQPDYSGLSPEEKQAREILDGIKRDAVSQAKNEITPMIEEFRVKAEIADLQKRYDDFNPDEVIPFALQNRILDLDSAYKVMNYEKKIQQVKEDAQRATATNFTRRGPAGGNPAPGQGGGRPQTGLQKYDPSKDAGKDARTLLEEGLAEVGY